MSEAAVRALEALAKNAEELTEFDLGVIVGKAEKIAEKDAKDKTSDQQKN